MAQYSVYIFCDECSQPHPGMILINLDDPNLDKETIGDIYAGRDLPPDIVTMQNNYYRCPNTGRMFTQKDNSQAFLVAVSP
jgi:hypothetical protein